MPAARAPFAAAAARLVAVQFFSAPPKVPKAVRFAATMNTLMVVKKGGRSQ